MGKEITSHSAFTKTEVGIVSKLFTPVDVVDNGNSIRVVAQWDTGATVTCISHDVVKYLSLISTGKMTMKTPSGSSEVSTYMVDVILPNNVTVKDIAVCDSEIGNQGIGMLIGMDIIGRGDFAVSNFNGKTVFTYRSPSVQVTDYVKRIAVAKAIGTPHGRGKKKR